MTLPLFIFASLNFSTNRWQAAAITVGCSGRGQGDSPYKKSIGLKNLVFLAGLAEDAAIVRGGSWPRIPPRVVNVLLLREEAHAGAEHFTLTPACRLFPLRSRISQGVLLVCCLDDSRFFRFCLDFAGRPVECALRTFILRGRRYVLRPAIDRVRTIFIYIARPGPATTREKR